MVREIKAAAITAAISEMCIAANLYLPDDVCRALDALRERESNPLGRMAAEQFAANREIAAREQLALCQDTGSAVVFADVGQEAHISGGLLEDAVNRGVAQGYREGYLRKSIVTALSRENSGDNTPAILHTRLVEGDQLKLTLLPKGGGAENMSRLAMLKPAAGEQGILIFLLETLRLAGSNPCPPVIIGVGIGGNFERAPLLAKYALLREIGSRHPEPEIAALEQTWLTAVNGLGIGIQGFGGEHTALDLFIETMPCHFASLPVAVNLNCHVARHRTVIL